jgi:hypothetical protein
MSKERIEEMKETIHTAISKAIEKGCVTWTEFADYLTEHLTEQGYRKQSEWISVEERLPEHEENVLVAVDYEHIRATGVYISSLLERRQGERWTHKGYTVTHWMPLPEAPKMKGGAE